jgi:CRP-like cAMP-binding protein
LFTLVKELNLVTMHDGEVLFEQGDIGETFYVILTGSVKGFAKSEELNEVG